MELIDSFCRNRQDSAASACRNGRDWSGMSVRVDDIGQIFSGSREAWLNTCLCGINRWLWSRVSVGVGRIGLVFVEACGIGPECLKEQMEIFKSVYECSQD